MDHRQKLENTYISIHAGIAVMMADIEEQFNNLPLPDRVDWGHVGDLNLVLGNLKSALNRLEEINGVKKEEN
jgi:hypothetical protein